MFTIQDNWCKKLLRLQSNNRENYLHTYQLSSKQHPFKYCLGGTILIALELFVFCYFPIAKSMHHLNIKKKFSRFAMLIFLLWIKTWHKEVLFSTIPSSLLTSTTKSAKCALNEICRYSMNHKKCSKDVVKNIEKWINWIKTYPMCR